jgi:crotonobetainyl-CoA:carnitine CoA-transferase CaiB-like acyl-CoA transferase
VSAARAPRPFDGVTVIELGQFVAVPYAGQMLADGGAHVIKIEPREGEPSRHLAPLVPGEEPALPHAQPRQALAALGAHDFAVTMVTCRVRRSVNPRRS